MLIVFTVVSLSLCVFFLAQIRKQMQWKEVEKQTIRNEWQDDVIYIR